MSLNHEINTQVGGHHKYCDCGFPQSNPPHEHARMTARELAQHIFRWGASSAQLPTQRFKEEQDKAIKQLESFIKTGKIYKPPFVERIENQP